MIDNTVLHHIMKKNLYFYENSEILNEKEF